jgi:hypothetical protein
MYIQVLRLSFWKCHAARIFPLLRFFFIAETDDSHLALGEKFSLDFSLAVVKSTSSAI